MSGAMSEMKQVTGDLGISDHGMNNHGAPAWFQTVKREDVGDIAGEWNYKNQWHYTYWHWKNYKLLFLLQLILEFPPLSSILREMEESSESHIMDTLKGMHNW